MRTPVVSFFALIVAVASVHGDLAETMRRMDALDDEGKHLQAFQALEAVLVMAPESDGRTKAEILWRLARASMYLGGEAERRGATEAELLSYYETGERYGQMAIDSDPTSFQSYFWKAGNAGRWGQTKGVLSALAKAFEMRKLLSQAMELNPDDRGPYLVLGLLFDEVPGPPIGFGNTEYAVSLGRKAVDLMERVVKDGVEDRPEYDYYTELAKHLYKRNWGVDRRARSVAENRSRLAAASDALSRGCFYESSVPIPAISDREEARALARKAVDGLTALPERTLSEEDTLREALDMLAASR